MSWVTAIGSSPEQIDYRLGLQHGCTVGEITDAQMDYRTEQERPLVWIGEGLADLGIVAGTKLTEGQFPLARAMMNGFHPHTGERLVEHKLAVPHDAKVPLAPLLRMIEGVAREAGVDIAEVLRHTEGRWVGLTSKRMLEMFQRAERTVERQGETATLRADHAGLLADAARLNVEEVWEPGIYTAAVSKLTKTVMVTNEDGAQTEQIVDNRVVVGNLGYDITLTMPKSFSLLRAFVDEATGAAIDAIYVEQGAAIFQWLENATAYGMRGHHGDGQTANIVQGSGFAGWAMIHRAARPTDGQPVGDPHWHVHYTIANMTKGEDGKWSTVAAGGRDLMRHVPAADKLLQAAVRKVLNERYGITFRRSERTQLWEVAGIPDAAIKEFSQRGADINAMLADLGFTEQQATPALKRLVKQVTRQAKGEATNAPESTLREYYLNRARDAGLAPDQMMRDVLGIPTTAASPSPTQRADITEAPTPTLGELVELLQDAYEGLTSRSRRFSRLDAICSIADAMPKGVSTQEVEALTDRVLLHAGFISLRKNDGEHSPGEAASLGQRKQLGADHMANAQLYTTQDILDAERIIVAAAQASHPNQTGIRVSAATAEMAAATIETINGFPLSAEQHRELLRIVTSGRQLDSLVGGPGSGKTTLMNVVRAAYEAQGFVIAGAATQGTTGQNLQAESGIPSRTVAQWLYRIQHGEGLRGIDILVLDEAAMTNDRDRAQLYKAAGTNVKIIETGDPKQLRGVGCGSMFAVLHKLLGGGELVENRRQVDADERAAIAAWRAGDYSAALNSWADRDRLVVAETGQEATSAMLATWIDQRQGAPDPFMEMRGLLMVASTNEQVDRLNSAAQAIRRAQGELGKGRTYELAGAHTVHLRKGDFVMIRINNRAPGEPVALNGYRGIIDRIRRDGRIDVRWERATNRGRIMETRTFSPDYVATGGLSLGYALTIHMSQGLTVGADAATWTDTDNQRRGGAVLFYGAGADNPGSTVALSRHKLSVWAFLGRKDVEGHQDEFLLGIPKTAFERTRRVITKMIDRAKATENNANDRPVLVDLGVLQDPRGNTNTAAPKPAGATRPGSGHSQRTRTPRDLLDDERRHVATHLLRQEWGENHPAVQRVTDGVAFGAVARWLGRIADSGADPRAALRTIDPNTVIGPKVLDPSRVTAAALKTIALTDPATVTAQTPKTKSQHRDHRAEREQAQREQAADLLREEWTDHANAELVITGSAFGAVAQNLASASAAGHDPRTLLRAIDPNEVFDKDNPSAFTAWKIRTMTAAGVPAKQQPDPATTRAVPVAPRPVTAARLDVLVPAYEDTVQRITRAPVPVATGPHNAPGSPEAPEVARPPHRDVMWPSWLPPAPEPQPLTGRDRALANAAAADAQRIRARVVELGRNAARDRPEWVQQLGPAPDGAAARSRYLAALTTIAAYREQHNITGADPIGPPPPGPHNPAYEAALRARNHLTDPAPRRPSSSQGRDVDREGPKRAQVHNDDARRRAERILDQQRRTPQQPEQAHRHGPGQGPRPGY